MCKTVESIQHQSTSFNFRIRCRIKTHVHESVYLTCLISFSSFLSDSDSQLDMIFRSTFFAFLLHRKLFLQFLFSVRCSMKTGKILVQFEGRWNWKSVDTRFYFLSKRFFFSETNIFELSQSKSPPLYRQPPLNCHRVSTFWMDEKITSSRFVRRRRFIWNKFLSLRIAELPHIVSWT